MLAFTLAITFFLLPRLARASAPASVTEAYDPTPLSAGKDYLISEPSGPRGPEVEAWFWRAGAWLEGYSFSMDTRCVPSETTDPGCAVQVVPRLSVHSTLVSNSHARE